MMTVYTLYIVLYRESDTHFIYKISWVTCTTIYNTLLTTMLYLLMRAGRATQIWVCSVLIHRVGRCVRVTRWELPDVLSLWCSLLFSYSRDLTLSRKPRRTAHAARNTNYLSRCREFPRSAIYKTHRGCGAEGLGHEYENFFCPPL